MKDRTKKFALGTIFAAIAGYVTGILTAPKSGKETREDIKDTAVKVKNEAEEKLAQLHKELDELLELAKKNTDHLRGTLKNQAAKSMEKAASVRDKVQTTLKEGGKDKRELKKAVKEVQTASRHLKKYISQYKEAAKDSFNNS